MEEIIQKLFQKENNPYLSDYKRAHSLIKQIRNVWVVTIILFLVSLATGIFLILPVILIISAILLITKYNELGHLREKVKTFEDSFFNFYLKKINGIYQDRLYRKHSTSEDFKLAVTEFITLINSLHEANKFLINKHFDLNHHVEYIEKRLHRAVNFSKTVEQSYSVKKLLEEQVEEDVVLPHTEVKLDNDVIIENTPVITPFTARTKEEIPTPEKIYFKSKIVDWNILDKLKMEIGKKGEELALYIEKEYLQESGRLDLAEMVRHVSVEDGDGAGYDILSYFLNGQEKYIEVKSTNQEIQRGFNISENEISFLKNHLSDSYIYRIKLPQSSDPRTSSIQILSAQDVLNAEIIPTQYIVKIPF